MPRDTGIADRLRKVGCKVVEVDGWRTRGSDTFNPRGSLDHHTAGGAQGNAPSLGVCINGRSDLPGPLCQVLVARDLTCYVIAAGRANHAGSGGWKGLAGNSSVYGVERENVGTAAEPWRPEQTIHAAKVHAALITGKANADMVCRHAEWAPTRKIDTHSISGTQLRGLVAKELNPPAPAPTPKPKEDDMPAPMLLRLTKKNADILYMSSARTVHWVRSTDALQGYKLDMQNNGYSPDVCVMTEIAAEDPKLEALNDFVVNLPFIGDWPQVNGVSTGTKEAWKGPWIKADAKT